MNSRPPSSRSDAGEAAWAYNRWPTIGLYSGAGVAALLGVLFRSGWLTMVGAIVGGAVLGCLIGLVLARVVYRSPGPPGDDEPAEDPTDPGP